MAVIAPQAVIAITAGQSVSTVAAMRHILALRASEAAEEEIAYVFGLIGKVMAEKEPEMFGDFTQTPEGYWVPKYPKV